ncbi:MAG TPA: hypothetical protein PLX35_06480 [Cyclobacteriaceae bacterium]|nr:hypothetical protein [Cyclobacteriaceae bacterium]
MNILFVSIAFPPRRDPESLQVAKYLKYMCQDKDLAVESITAANPLFMEEDKSLEVYRQNMGAVHEVRIWENRYTNFLLRKLNPEWLQYPDSKFSFWRRSSTALATVRQIPDLIYSRSYPVSSTLLALACKRKYNVPWVLHLSDPWAVSSDNFLSPATRLTGKARKWNKAQEEECFRLADRIALTSARTISLYQEAYPQWRDKFVYFPNVYDDDLVQPVPHRINSTLKFVYTGGFGQARSPLPLLEAIQEFYRLRSEEVGDQLQFIFTGEMTRGNQAIFDTVRVPWIQRRGVVSYDEVRRLQREADILLNVDSDIGDADHAVFFPSKLLEYMIVQRRILAITNRHSTTHDVVQGSLGDCFEFNDLKGIVNSFWQAFQAYKAGHSAYFEIKGIQEIYSARQNAQRLIELFHDLAGR